MMDYNVVNNLKNIAQSHPELCAIKVPLRCKKTDDLSYKDISFKELFAQVNATSHYLRSKNIAPGTRTLLLTEPGLNLILITFALIQLGAIPIVIDPGMSIKNFLNSVRASKPDALIGNGKALAASRIFFNSFKSVKIKIKADKKFSEKLNFEKIEPIKTYESDPAAILFTSGSTGSPKGVCYSHRHFNSQLKLLKNNLNITPGETDLSLLPIFALFNPGLGMTTVIPEMNPKKPAELDPKKIAEAIIKANVTNVFGSPRLWVKLESYCKKNDIIFPSLKRVLMAGAPVPPSLVEGVKSIIPNGEVFTPYGATEALPICCISGKEILKEALHLRLKGKGTCVGKPIDSVEVKILPLSDSHFDLNILEHNLPANMIGEIAVKGPSVTEMYDNAPEATKLSKIFAKEHVWHRMGDLGYLDANGRLWFCGRKAERVVTSKGILFTECCEPIFQKHPKVFRAALIGLKLKQTPWDIPAIVVEPYRDFFPKKEDEIATFIDELILLAQEFSHTKNIKHFFFQKNFPVDVRHNAKIHRLKLARNFSKKLN